MLMGEVDITSHLCILNREPKGDKESPHLFKAKLAMVKVSDITGIPKPTEDSVQEKEH